MFQKLQNIKLLIFYFLNFIFKKISFRLLVFIMTAVLTGCYSMDPVNTAVLGVQAIQAITVSNKEVKYLADQACNELDHRYKILGVGTSYYNRLSHLSKDLDQSIHGTKLDFKVYLSKEINAFALANGCVRVYSGLIDILDNDEIRSVLAHEIGHVALNHHKKSYQLMKASLVAISAAGAYTGVGVLNNALFQDALYSIINSKFSKTQEIQADNYSVDMMIRNYKPAISLATALEKIENLHNNNINAFGYLFNDHPSTGYRVRNIKNRIYLIEKNNLKNKDN